MSEEKEKLYNLHIWTTDGSSSYVSNISDNEIEELYEYLNCGVDFIPIGDNYFQKKLIKRILVCEEKEKPHCF